MLTELEIQSIVGKRFKVSLSCNRHDVWIWSSAKKRPTLRCRFWQGLTRGWVDQTPIFILWVRNGCRGKCTPFPPRRSSAAQ